MYESKTIKAVLFSAVVATIAGCQQGAPINHADEFAPDDQVTQVTKLADVQAARGARAEATLFAIHFDGDHLSTLGMAKLDVMLKDDASAPLKLWLAIPDDENLAAREEAINAYLKDHGVATEKVVFGRGPNPDMDHPAAKGLTDLANMDTASSSSSSSSSSSTPGSSSAAPSATGGTPGSP
jgi:predicted small lipoprotein YifL